MTTPNHNRVGKSDDQTGEKWESIDSSLRICELVRYRMSEINLKGAWSGPGALDLHPHALAPVAALPVLEVVSAVHIVADATLPLGTVVHDYLHR